MINRYRIRKGISWGMSRLVLFLIALFACFPVLLVLLYSFRSPYDIWTYPPKLFAPFTLINFRQVFGESPQFIESLGNSFIITMGTLFLSLMCCLPAAFGLSRFKHTKLMRVSSILLMCIRMFPVIVISIPLYPAFRALGLIDKHISLVILNTVFNLSLGTMMMKNFIDDISVELEEAAMIEGCTRFRSFWKVTVPLTAPGIAAVAIFVAISVWNEYTFALIFSASDTITAPIMISGMRSSELGIPWGVLFASSMMQMLPMVIMVMFVQKYLIRGTATGAIK